MSKILLLTIIMIILQMVIFGLSYRTIRDIKKNVDETYDVFAKPAMWVLEAKSNAIQARRLASRVLDIDSAGKDEIVAMVKENRQRVDELLRTYESTIFHDDEREIFKKLIQYQNDAIVKQDRIIEAGMSGDPILIQETYKRLYLDGDITVTENEYMTTFDSLAKLLIDYADEENDKSHATASIEQAQTLVVSVIALITGLALSILIARTITFPVRRTEANIALFAQGDLNCTFDTQGKDEIATMGRSLQDMARNLAGIIGSVKGASDNINETAHDFSSLSEETSASMQEFKANVDSMSTNLSALALTGEQVSASVQEVASGAQATAEHGTRIARKVSEAMTAGENGMKTVLKAVNGIDGVASSVTDAAKSVQELGERTRQIQNFVTQIGGIADQTNLLALNAAIEAARAGDAGRGFAVVAEEVRKLAEDSNLAAKNIEDLAKTITEELDQVVTISLENARASVDAKDVSRETEEIIKDMISALADIAGATQDLAAISQEQAASSEEIAESVQNITIKVKDTAETGEFLRSGVSEVSSAAERMALGANGLSSLALDMHRTLDYFKFSENPALATKSSGKLALKC
jgi:methyl-accepting chemotaxis protein